MPPTTKVPGTFPYPGGWLLGAPLLINLLAAHVGLTIKLIRTGAGSREFRTLMLKGASGILILHFGVVVMMVGELITGWYAVEGVITIPTDRASNYLESQRKIEFAVVDSSDPTTDDMVVISGGRLRRGGLIQDVHLPFDVEVHQFMANSALVKAGPANPATAGDGLVRDGSGKAGGQRYRLGAGPKTCLPPTSRLRRKAAMRPWAPSWCCGRFASAAATSDRGRQDLRPGAAPRTDL